MRGFCFFFFSVSVCFLFVRLLSMFLGFIKREFMSSIDRGICRDLGFFFLTVFYIFFLEIGVVIN